MADHNVKQPLKKLRPILIEARERNLNEADTRMRVVRLLSDVLGYDELSEITSEQRVRDRFVDFAIKIDGVIKFLVEVKAGGITLRDRHIDQAERYAAEGNIRWVILTNGVMWNLYHLTFEDGIDYERAFTVDLSSDSIDQAASLLGIMHRKSVIKEHHQRFWKGKLALGPKSLGKALFTESVLRPLRRELRRQEGFLIDPEDLAKALQELFTPEAREEMGPAKIRKSRASKSKIRRSKRPAQDVPAPQETIPPELVDTKGE